MSEKFVLVIFFFVIFRSHMFQDADASRPFANDGEERELVRLEVCGGRCLSQYPEVEQFVNTYSLELRGLVVLFTSEIPKLSLYNEKAEVVRIYDVSEMKSSEILKIVQNYGCILTNKILSENEQLEYYLTNKLTMTSYQDILQNKPPGIYNYYLGGLNLQLEKVNVAIGKYNKSINEGYAPAIMKLSEIFYEGSNYGIESNYERAFELLSMAVEKELADSFSNMATMYLKGKGVKQNFTVAMKFLNRGAAVNDSASFIALGMIHHCGIIIEKDIIKAVEFYKLGLAVEKNAITKKTVRKLIQYANGSRNLMKKEMEKLDKILHSMTE